MAFGLSAEPLRSLFYTMSSTGQSTRFNDPKVYAGAHTALITPFLNGKVAWGDLKKLVDFQIAAGINGLISVGTTGESPTLGYDEHIEVIQRTVEYSAGRVPVMAGTGSNATTEALDLTKRAEEVGADAFLLVAPYYNKPSQEGLYRHFSVIAESTAKPIMLYSAHQDPPGWRIVWPVQQRVGKFHRILESRKFARRKLFAPLDTTPKTLAPDA